MLPKPSKKVASIFIQKLLPDYGWVLYRIQKNGGWLRFQGWLDQAIHQLKIQDYGLYYTDESAFAKFLIAALFEATEWNALQTRLEAASHEERSRFIGGSGKLFCEMCGAPPLSIKAALHDAHFEAHYLIPLSSTGPRTTRLSDLALLCANCHRLLHRAMAIEKRWLTLVEAKAICRV